MSEELFSAEDRESLIGFMEKRGGTREQAEFAARQLMKKAAMIAEEQGIAPIEAMGQLLSKVSRMEQIMEENAGGLPPKTKD